MGWVVCSSVQKNCVRILMFNKEFNMRLFILMHFQVLRVFHLDVLTSRVEWKV